MLEGVRGRRPGTAIFIAIMFALIVTVAQRFAEDQLRGADEVGVSALAFSFNPVSVAD